ncbi:hypothetical protein HCN51_36390 [Nonomuraea sp. FMUSA5-5]|uniref:Outer membrane channel protein CpnT-like N-terminal domain-containing protein n=1 Tax=Nonomuraea composti TaxID=2720023 RepID=A0ABX1BAQ2_9ACTN|nr:hypothetical protein [Nonomuraea sp. FMUSA5-5]NJP94855.1 hypothetical protein [Nonomuraea sp. FMUSA5-5]
MRPWIGWVVGMDWPEGDEAKLFQLADDLARAFHRINGGVRGDGRLAGGAASGTRHGVWDGQALEAFLERAKEMTGGRKAELLERLAGMALACNDLGVQVQYTKRMIKLSVLLLMVQLIWLLWAALSPASGIAWSAAGARARVTRAMIRQLAKRLLLNIALFGLLMGGVDLYIQATQSRRDGIDLAQVGWSALSGAITGGLLTLTTGLLPPRSILAMMGHSGVAGGGTSLAVMALRGDPIDWEAVAKGATGGALSSVDVRVATWSPRTAAAAPATTTASAPSRPVTAPGAPRPSINRIDWLINRPHDEPPAHPTRTHDGAVPRARPQTPDPAVPPHPGHRPIPPDLAEAFAAVGPDDGLRLGGGVSARSVRLLTFEDGSSWVFKQVKTTREADAEELGSILGERIGANVPAVYRLDPHRVAMPYVATGTPMAIAPVAMDSLPAKVLGLLHVLNRDADANSLNIIVDEHGHPWGIDMSAAFHEVSEKYRGVLPEVTNSPLADPWVSRTWSGLLIQSFRYLPNELNQADVAWLAGQIRSTRPAFEALGRADWYAKVWSRFVAIAENAAGTRSMFEQE